MEKTNRVLWIIVFLAGAAAFAWLELRGQDRSPMIWFLLTSLWSAVCGIGFTACSWWLSRQGRPE